MKDPEFENDHVCVWKMILTPDCSLDIGRDRIIFCHLDGSLKQIGHEAVKEPTEVMIIEMKPLKNSPLPNRPID